MSFTNRSDSRKGFTLLEVVIALGVFTFGLMGMISLLPQTILTHRQAISNTVLAQITQQVTGEVQMCGPNEFAQTYKSNQPQVWYFDYQGNQLTSGSPGIVYRAQAVVTSVQLSGTPTPALSSCLQLVQIYATFDPTSAGTVLSNLVQTGAPTGVIVVDQPPVIAGVGGL
jgi:uncharacterized protein (TIGR02598 family)